MKKAIWVMLLCGIVVSCGPRRLGCGPGRCEVAKTQKNYERDC